MVRKTSFWGTILFGMIASFMVPLFLTMVGQSFVDGGKSVIEALKAKEGSEDVWFILIGACLAASVSAKTFISTVSGRFVQGMDDLKKRVSAQEMRMETLETDVTEVEKKVVSTPGKSSRGNVEIDENERHILQVIRDTPSRHLTLENLRHDGGLSDLRINHLDELVQKGLMKKESFGGQLHYRANLAGLSLAEEPE